MAENITSLADTLERVGLTPADLVALGAAISAAAAAGILTKTALRNIELMRSEIAQTSPADRLLLAKEASSILNTLVANFGAEGTAKVLEQIGPAAEGVGSVVKEALMVGSVLPDEVK
jgi:hypothetical protein